MACGYWQVFMCMRMHMLYVRHQGSSAPKGGSATKGAADSSEPKGAKGSSEPKDGKGSSET